MGVRLEKFVASYNNFLAFLTALLTILGALGIVIGFGWKIFTDYVETQITKRTEFQRAVLTGITANVNQDHDFAIRTLHDVVQNDEFKSRSWDEAATAVDNMLNAITDSGNHSEYAAEYGFLQKVIGPHQDEHGFYRLHMGYGALFIERDADKAVTMFSRAIQIYISQHMYNDAAFAYQGKVIAYGVKGRSDLAARNMVSASICNPLHFPEDEWERRVRNWPNGKWLAQFLMGHPGILQLLKDASNIAKRTYASVTAKAGGSCIHTQE